MAVLRVVGLVLGWLALCGAFLFYRTLSFDGPHQLVPAVLPVLSATRKAWGLGINVLAVPRVKLSGGTMPNVIYAQFTKAF